MRAKRKRAPNISSLGIAMCILASGKPDWFMSSPVQYQHVYGRQPVIRGGHSVIMPGFGEVCVHLVIDEIDDQPRFLHVQWSISNPFAELTDRRTVHITSLALIRGDTNKRKAKGITKLLGELVNR